MPSRVMLLWRAARAVDGTVSCVLVLNRTSVLDIGTIAGVSDSCLKIGNISSFERDLLDLSLIERVSNGCIHQVQSRRFAGDLDNLGSSSNFQLNIGGG